MDIKDLLKLINRVGFTGPGGIEKIVKILKELVEKLNTVVTEEEIEEILLNYYTKEEAQTILSGYVTDTQIEAYYTKEEVNLIVSALGNNSYRVAWNGSTQPTVANIPAGVVVTYNNTDYTGTLSASANTTNSIYLVGQDMYVTSKDGNIYSWVFAGTTELELDDYATKTEVSQLEAEVTGLSDEIDATNAKLKNYTEGYYLDRYGTLHENASYDVSDFIPYEDGKNVVYWWSDTMADATTIKIVFYDENKAAINNGYWSANSGTIANGKVISAADIANDCPGAKFVRASYVHGSTLAKVVVGTTEWPKQDNMVAGLDVFKNDVKELGKELAGTAKNTESFNLLNPVTCFDKTVLNSSTGAASSNSSYWSTDFIPVDTTKDTKLILSYPFVFRIALFKSDGTILDVYTSAAERENPIDITGAASVRFCFAKTTVEFEERFGIRVYYANNYSTDTHEVLDPKNTFKDPQFISINDIIGFATNKISRAFSSSFSFRIWKGSQGNKPMVILADAKFTNSVDDAVPTIRFTYNARLDAAYSSAYYTIGEKDTYREKEWRIPPFFPYCDVVDVTVTIPENVTLYINGISNYFSDSVSRKTTGLCFNSHSSFGGGAGIQFCSLEAFKMAARLGFPCAVAVPKRTSDGEWVCYHDDGAVGTTLNREGVALTAEEQAKKISEFTLSEIDGMNYAIDKFGVYRKVPTLEQFFATCSKTGMIPMLSVHPYPLESEWGEIKSLALKYGVLESLRIKAGSVTSLELAYGVMGVGVGGYILVCKTGTSADGAVANMDEVFSDAKGKVRLAIEMSTDIVTGTRVSGFISSGYYASIFGTNTSAEQTKKWMEMGVSEFTEDYNASFGLDW